MFANLWSFLTIFYLSVLVRQNSFAEEFNSLVGEADKWEIQAWSWFLTIFAIGRKVRHAQGIRPLQVWNLWSNLVAKRALWAEVLYYTYVLNHSLNGSSTRQKNWANGNKAHLLDERLQFGSADSITLINGVMLHADEIIQQIKHYCHVSPWTSIFHYLFFDSYNIKI